MPVAGAAIACTGSVAADGTDGVVGGGPPSFEPAGSVKIEFEPPGPFLRLRPKERVPVTAIVTPAAAYTVHFALLGPAEAAHDAVLTASEVVSDTRGRAEVQLLGPSAATEELALRAQVGRSSSQIPILVEPGGRLRLEVRARYTGRRMVTEWLVSVHPGTACESFGSELPPDSDQPARVAFDEPAILQHEDVTPTLSVTVRSGELASGCVTLNGNVAIENPVIVPVHDRPLRLENTALDVAFQLNADDAAFGHALDTDLVLVRDAFRGGSADDPEALLDAMQGELQAAQVDGFIQNRETPAWQARLDTAFSGEAALLSNTLARWSRIGRAALLSPRAFEGRLAGDSAEPQLEIARVGGIPAEVIDFNVDRPAWGVDADDVIVLGAEFSWLQSELVAGLAQGAAIAETGAPDVPEALAAVAGCPALAAALFGASTADFQASCGAACLETACRRALAVMWQRARSASAETRTRLALAATGRAVVGELAEATSVEGTWVGRLSTDGSHAESETGGEAIGFAPKGAARR